MLEEEIRDYITGDSMKMKESKKPDHDDKGPTWQGHGNIQSIFRFAVNDINIGGKNVLRTKSYRLVRVNQS